MVEFIRYNGNGQDDIIMQPIWESFYKDVIGQSTTLIQKDLPGLDFEEGGNFWDSIVNVKVVANLFFTYIAIFSFFSSFVIRMIYDHGLLSNWVLTPFPPCADH